MFYLQRNTTTMSPQIDESALTYLRGELCSYWIESNKGSQQGRKRRTLKRTNHRSLDGNPFEIDKGRVTALLDCIQKVRAGEPYHLPTPTPPVQTLPEPAPTPSPQAPPSPNSKRRYKKPLSPIAVPTAEPTTDPSPKGLVEDIEDRRERMGERPWRSKPQNIPERERIPSYIKTMDGKVIRNPQAPLKHVVKCPKSHVLLPMEDDRKEDLMRVGGQDLCTECEEERAAFTCKECLTPYYICEKCLKGLEEKPDGTRRHSSYSLTRYGSTRSGSRIGSRRQSKSSDVGGGSTGGRRKSYPSPVTNASDTPILRADSDPCVDGGFGSGSGSADGRGIGGGGAQSIRPAAGLKSFLAGLHLEGVEDVGDEDDTPAASDADRDDVVSVVHSDYSDM